MSASELCPRWRRQSAAHSSAALASILSASVLGCAAAAAKNEVCGDAPAVATEADPWANNDVVLASSWTALVAWDSAVFGSSWDAARDASARAEREARRVKICLAVSRTERMSDVDDWAMWGSSRGSDTQVLQNSCASPKESRRERAELMTW